MRCKCLSNDPEKFATNLRRTVQTKNLTWDNANGQDVIIVQTPFGESAVSILDDICKALNGIEVPSDSFAKILDGVWVRYVSAADKVKNNGCPLNGEASSYTVFSCCREKDVLKVYRPQEQAMSKPTVDIPLEINAKVTRDAVKKGFGPFQKSVETGFYCISFPRELEDKYMEGSLSYRINGFEIPVTKKMFSQGMVYVESSVQPELVPKNRGLKIISS